jgi:hypothetical protein
MIIAEIETLNALLPPSGDTSEIRSELLSWPSSPCAEPFVTPATSRNIDRKLSRRKPSENYG